jgi:hypothetical protein
MLSLVVFALAFLVGVAMSAVSGPSARVIYVHPTPENSSDYVFRDRAGVCFAVKPQTTRCTDSTLEYPVQT